MATKQKQGKVNKLRRKPARQAKRERNVRRHERGEPTARGSRGGRPPEVLLCALGKGLAQRSGVLSERARQESGR